jgi:4-amino-4-deoxy-L-arabinose transferase-like glycosyltransferase
LTSGAAQSVTDRAGLAAPTLVFFLLAYLLLGLIGHDPWKADEPYGFGLIYGILRSGDWVVPTLVGEPFMEKPPLYYLSAAWVARMLSPPLALHDAARLTSGLYMALTLWFTGLSARAMWGKGKEWAAVFALTGCLGLIGSAHEILTDVALLAGFAIAYFGLSIGRIRPVAAGIALGTGAGIGFMSKGLVAPGMVGVIAALLPLCSRHWRIRVYQQSLIVAALALLPWLILWPWALYRRSPQLFMDWLWLNNIGRYWGFAGLGADAKPWFYTDTLWWFAWPAWPLALWTLWRARALGAAYASVCLPVLSAVVIMSILTLSASARALYALPVLVPLAALAAGAADEVPARVAAWLDWAARLFWSAFALFIWAAWIALVSGHPLQIAAMEKYLPLQFVAQVQWLPLVMAVVLVLAWLLAMRCLAQSRLRAVASWSLGMTLCWGTLNTLWLPWLDAAKSYRAVYASLQRALPPGYGCVAAEGVGESERAMLEYFTGIVPLRMASRRAADCTLRLVQDGAGDGDVGPGRDWRLIWPGGRLGDANERHRLFQRRVDGE